MHFPNADPDIAAVTAKSACSLYSRLCNQLYQWLYNEL